MFAIPRGQEWEFKPKDISFVAYLFAYTIEILSNLQNINIIKYAVAR